MNRICPLTTQNKIIKRKIRHIAFRQVTKKNLREVRRRVGDFFFTSSASKEIFMIFRQFFLCGEKKKRKRRKKKEKKKWRVVKKIWPLSPLVNLMVMGPTWPRWAESTCLEIFSARWDFSLSKIGKRNRRDDEKQIFMKKKKLADINFVYLTSPKWKQIFDTSSDLSVGGALGHVMSFSLKTVHFSGRNCPSSNPSSWNVCENKWLNGLTKLEDLKENEWNFEDKKLNGINWIDGAPEISRKRMQFQWENQMSSHKKNKLKTKSGTDLVLSGKKGQNWGETKTRQQPAGKIHN